MDDKEELKIEEVIKDEPKEEKKQEEVEELVETTPVEELEEKEEITEEPKEEKIVEEKKDHSSKKLAIIISCIVVVLITVLIVCFVVFFNGDKTVINKTEQGASFELNYTDKNNVLTIENAQPVTDSIGINDLTGDNYFEFSVSSEIENATKASYIVAVEKNAKKCTILDKDIKIYLEKEESGSYETVFEPHEFEKSKLVEGYNMDKGVMILNKVTTKKDTTDNYRLKIWLADTGINSVGKNYSLKVKVYGYSE